MWGRTASVRRRVAFVIVALLGAAVVSAAAPASAASTASPATPASAVRSAAPAVRVAGNVIVDPAGTAVKFLGVNRSGSQYLCQRRQGFFDGPTDQGAIDLLRSWNVNLVRIPLNEHCWLGVADNPTWTGAPYRAAIEDFVARLEANGITADLELHYTSATSDTAEQRNEMPNTAVSLPFWTSVATTFRTDRAVLFEPYNEPHDVSVDCWLHGCTTTAGWQAAGYQQLVDTIRATGATQPIVVNGLNWGHDMSPLLTSMPVDPRNALVAGQHLYNFKSCVTASCWDTQFAPVAARYPMIATEVGVNDCSSAMPLAFLRWMRTHGGDGVAFWNFGVTGCPDGGGRTGGSSLIADWSGTPTPLGEAVRTAFTSRAATVAPPTVTCPGDQYAAEYFVGADLSGAPAAAACEAVVQHAWGSRAPVPGLPADAFSVRWSRSITVGGGVYDLTLTSDDGMRVFVDGDLVVDDWLDHGTRTVREAVPLTAGVHSLRVEYHDTAGNATARFSWAAAV